MSGFSRDDGDAYWLLPLQRAHAERQRQAPALRASKVRSAAPIQRGSPRTWRDVIEHPAPKPVPVITQADVDAMSPELIRIGLMTGGLVRDPSGRVVPAPDEDAERKGGQSEP